MACLKQILTPTMVPVIPTGTKSPEDVDRAKEALVAEGAVVAVTIAETTQLLDIHLKGK